MRRAVAVAAVGAAFLLSACASVPAPLPTKERPRTFCAVSCPGGWLSRNAKVCRGKRWFRDFLANGEYVRRGADGTVLTNVWTSEDGDFDKRDVVQMPCSSYIAQVISSRSPEQRGINPGEDEQGRPMGL